ncbi:MAG TPA: hypothetical protein VKT28_14355 [Puia sp.]|nr:hypothetical protein [Puia sp.]
MLLAIFCFYFIPYQLIDAKSYVHFGDWENAAKELALSAGAFVIADCYSENMINLRKNFFERLIPYGAILYAITIISFSIDHFLYAKEAADYVPSWIPAHLFWIYFCGAALLASGIAIILKIKTRLATTLLGSMILIWFFILHIPYVIAASSAAEKAGETASACLALAYSAIAFVMLKSASCPLSFSNTAIHLLQLFQ